MTINIHHSAIGVQCDIEADVYIIQEVERCGQILKMGTLTMTTLISKG
jgi:hypothetical protein